MSDSRYIGTGGRITFRSGITIRDFSSKRLAFITVLGLLLFLSNPGNQHSTGSNNKFKWSPFTSTLGERGGRTFQIPFLGIVINISSLSSPSSSTSSSPNDMTYSKYNRNHKTSHHQYGTNYHLFTLTKTINGIDMGILNNNINLCNFNTGLPNLCRILSNYACHNDQLSLHNMNNRAFTILRILQIMKITSFLLHFCYKYNTYMTLFPKIELEMTKWNRRRTILCNITQPLVIISSVFHETNSIRDLISLSFFVYPSLVVWERIVKSTIATTTNAAMTVLYNYFISITVIIFLFIGGMSNLLSSIILSNKVGGMKGCIASSLGFLAAVSPNDIIVNLLDIQLTASEVLFGTFVMTILPLLIGIQSSRRAGTEWDMGNIVSWTIGGIIGNILGEYQKDRLLPWIMRIFP
jgi:hypothetical protein